MSDLPIIYRCLLLIILLPCITGCGGGQTVEQSILSSSVTPAQVSDSTASALVDSISFLPLREINGKLLRTPGKVRFNNGLVYVGDHFINTDKIFVYDALTGEPKFLLDRRGQGPEEYLEIRNFAVDSNGLYIIDNFAGKLKVYDPSDGKYIKEMQLPLVVSDIEPLASGGFVLAATLLMPDMGTLKIPQDNHRLFITDSSLNITAKSIPVKRGEEGVMSTPRILTRNGDDIYFYSTMHEGIYDLTDIKDKKIKKIPVVFNNGLEGHADVSSEEISNYDYFFDAPIISGNYVYLEYKGGYGIWNGRDGMLYKDSDGSDEVPVGRMIAADGDAFVSYAENEEVCERLKNRFHVIPDSDIEQKNNDGESMLIFFHMK